MKMHKTFTRVPQRSYDAFVGRRRATLDALLAAFSVEPLEAEDALREHEINGIPKSLEYFASLGRLSFVSALETISQWALAQKDGYKALEAIISYDRRLGVWCACQVAKQTLPLIPSDEQRPAWAVEAAEQWVIVPSVSEARLRNAAWRALDFADEVDGRGYLDMSSFFAASAAGNAVNCIFRKEPLKHAWLTVYQTAAAASFRAAYIDKTKDRSVLEKAEAVRLREVVANACLSYPVLP